MEKDRIEWSEPLASMFEKGSYLIIRNFGGQEVLADKARRLIKDEVERLRGFEARAHLEQSGLSKLHEVLPAEQIGALRDAVMPALRPALFDLTVEIARGLLHIEGEFFVDEYTILRINFPYLVAKRAPMNAENPGIGRVSDSTRKASKAAQVIDPVYNPRAYHNNEPPPAWAHGPHQDTWTGHSRFGVNLWWAVNDVLEENSMIFYPQTFGNNFRPDPRSLYLAEGFPLPQPTKMALRAGEMLIFNPEMLHGSHLNTSESTRLALSTRINPRKPRFDPSCFYAREFWHSSRNLEARRYDQVIRFERLQHLTDASEGLANSSVDRAERDELELTPQRGAHQWQEICPSERIDVGAKLPLRVGTERLMILRSAHGLRATQSRCAHLDISLLDGYHDDETLYCPAHGVSFALSNGTSSCPALTLKTYEVKEEAGKVWLRMPANGHHGSAGEA